MYARMYYQEDLYIMSIVNCKIFNSYLKLTLRNCSRRRIRMMRIKQRGFFFLFHLYYFNLFNIITVEYKKHLFILLELNLYYRIWNLLVSILIETFIINLYLIEEIIIYVYIK